MMRCASNAAWMCGTLGWSGKFRRIVCWHESHNFSLASFGSAVISSGRWPKFSTDPCQCQQRGHLTLRPSFIVETSSVGMALPKCAFCVNLASMKAGVRHFECARCKSDSFTLDGPRPNSQHFDAPLFVVCAGCGLVHGLPTKVRRRSRRKKVAALSLAGVERLTAAAPTPEV